MTVVLGIEVLEKQGFAPLKAKRIGLMTNPSAVTGQLRSSYDIFADSEDIQLVALFGPEHGFAASAQDGEKVASAVDARTGVPVYSLYGETLKPSDEMLANVELMVCDIQDIGVRYYTFLWTITHIMDACARLHIPLMIFDRPNPLGDRVAGSGLDMQQSSLVGRYDIPIQHGMTLGEMAQFINHECNDTPCDLQIIACENYYRDLGWDETGLCFIPPSPNMPHLVTAQHYAGACLIEGTTLSEGRGTTLPFEIVGSPDIDAHQLARELNALKLEGVRFREHIFMPIASKHRGETCYGVQVHITDAKAYRPIETWVNILWMIQNLFPDSFSWLEHHIDRLIGSSSFREAMDAGASPSELMATWASNAEAFREKRKPYLIYQDAR